MAKIPKKIVFELLTDPNIFLQIAGKKKVRIEVETCSVTVSKGTIRLKPYLMVEIRHYSETGATIKTYGYTFQAWRLTKRMTEQGVINYVIPW